MCGQAQQPERLGHGTAPGGTRVNGSRGSVEPTRLHGLRPIEDLPVLPPEVVEVRALLPRWCSCTSREEWFNRLVDLLRPWFWKHAGCKLPGHIRVSCSWAYGRKSERAIGQCWDPCVSDDGYWEIMVSYAHDCAVEAALTLVHELCHVAAGLDARHGPGFKRVAEAVGLRGKMETTETETVELRRHLQDLVARHLGPYPGAPMRPGRTGTTGIIWSGGPILTSGVPPQTNRQMLIECDKCGVKLRGSRGVGQGKGKQQGSGGVRALMPRPPSGFLCPCGGTFQPDLPEMIWPEVYYLTGWLWFILTTEVI